MIGKSAQGYILVPIKNKCTVHSKSPLSFISMCCYYLTAAFAKILVL